ncbi:MAG: serine/threonine protein kinase [Clostridium sp.]|nr:serine/threonine protein kinase [Bacteroides sp.]MCM1197408.1 serine/threonine protein kinase [Clostridium sp.]
METQTGILFNSRYRLIEEKGRGSFGEVWLARDEQLELDVAIKIYIALDERGIEDFKREYKSAYKLNHPNLLHAYHFDICERRPFLVMPYCPDSAISLIGNCDNDTLWKFIKEVSSGLSYLHSLDIVHHDIKPDNILVTEDGTFAITDFGISDNMRSTLRRNSTRSMERNSSGGSLPYMGPEMFTSRPESIKATDVWALGVTLYEIITGNLPFFGQGGVMLQNGAAIPDIEYPDKNIVNLIRICLAKETWDRPTAEEIVKMAESRTFISKSPNNQSRTSGSKKTVKKGQPAPSSERQRHWFTNAYILLVIALNTILTGVYGYYTYITDFNMTECRVMALCSIVATIGGCMMWKYIRTGFWLFTAAQLVSTIATICITDNFTALISYPMGMMLAFGILQIKKNGVTAWKQMDYKMARIPIVYSTAIILAFVILVLPNSYVLDARQNFNYYSSNVEKCRGIISKANPEVDELLYAKELYKEIVKDENTYDDLHKGYCQSSNIRGKLKSKLEEASESWTKAADVQKRIGNNDKANEFYDIASKLKLE